MTEQKPMTADEQAQAASKRAQDAEAHMTDHKLAERVRAAHPHAAASDDATKVMLADYDRLKGEQDKAAKPE